MGTNTGIGIGIGIPFKNNALGGDRPYLPPELKARLIGVWDNYGKKNTDADRNIIKNKIPNAGGDLEILNAAYEGMSGYNGYPVVFGANKTWANESNGYVTSITSNTIHIANVLNAGLALLYSYVKYNGNLQNIKEIPPFKIEIKGLEGRSKFIYKYLATSDATKETNLYLGNGTHELPKSFLPTEALINNAVVGFSISPIEEGVTNFLSDITIEVLPEYEGAFVTDGIDDLITSTKTVQEMLGGSNEITVVSMIHQIGLGCRTNFICDKGSYWRCNEVANTGEGKTGIYGYSSTNISVNTPNIINNVLGDKVDYSVTGDRNDLTPSQFSVVGYISSSGKISYTSSVAWYWTIIANKVLTTDQINQVIAYFNLDRTLKPDILCNTIKQGITNENHAEFGDKLIDFSGNGRDIQLNNIAWKWDSGIGKYVEDFTTWYGATGVLQTFSKIEVTDGFKHNWVINRRSGESAINSFKVLIKGIPENGYIQYRYFESEDATKKSSIDIYEDGEYSLPNSTLNNLNDLVGFQLFVKIPPLDSQSFIGLTITQIPSHAGALCLDGVNDFGKVTGLPIYKDYTVVADYVRTFAKENVQDAPILSKSQVAGDGAFLFNYLNVNSVISSYSFGTNNVLTNVSDSERKIYYQSKYVNGGKSINSGTGTDYDSMWLGTYRDDNQIFFTGAIYSLMSFPYSMSEFLIERQLKKHKLGTLYPNMMEFRPIIKSNIDTLKINYWDKDWNVVNVGDYVSVGNDIKTNITVPNGYKVSKVTSDAFDNITIEKSSTDFIYDVKFYGIKKSPQKINLTIEQDENYVKWNPVINSNIEYKNALYYIVINGVWTRINSGDYINIKERIAIAIFPNGIDELVSVTSSDLNNISVIRINNNGEFYYFLANLTSNSPQNIDITIDEYIRYEDIVQPYPAFYEFTDENRNLVTWGSKIKVGSTITRIKAFANSNLLKDLYNISYPKLNGVASAGSKYVVERQMVFTCTATYLLDNNEPKCILSPRLLRIPNSSYKILGHIPDISGHGNHGVIHNSAYTEGSGVNEDGSYQFDGVDDFVTIPTLSSGGKQMLMKVNWNSLNHVLYDQRNNAEAPFCIVTASGSIAYNQKNVGGNTYIDGILNNHILVADLQAITHNIVLNNDYNVANSNSFIGTNYTKSIYAKMSLYDFMLFDEISTDDKILELNEYVGIEGNTE